MSINTSFNYSPNFDEKKRNKKYIKYILFHYTGMKSENSAINRLTKIQSEVSSHYLIKNNGKIISLVPDSYTAWHAGASSWKKIKGLNKYSIGIEISNPGHKHGYKNFSKKQISSVLKLSKFLIKKYKIKSQNILGHSDISPYRKKDPGEKFPWRLLSKKKIGYWHNINKDILLKKRGLKTNDEEKKMFFNNLVKIGYSKNNNRYLRIITSTFQRRFRQKIIDGKVDQECLIISKNLAKKHN